VASRHSRLTWAAWWIYAVDVLLGAVLIIAGLTDSGDPAGRGLAQVYAVGCVIALVAFGAVLGVSTYFRSRVGLWLSVVIMTAPPILFFVGLAQQIF
jgi:hypothetical protein